MEDKRSILDRIKKKSPQKTDKEEKQSSSRSRSRSKSKENKRRNRQETFSIEKIMNFQLRSQNDNLLATFEIKIITETENLKDTDNPAYNKNVGSNNELNQIKNQINPFEKEWDRIKLMLNDYELVDIHRFEDKASQRYAIPQINYNIKNGGLQWVFSRAYFKLWEVLKQNNILSKYVGEQVKIATIAEGPGGFIHSLIDYRQQQYDPRKSRIWDKDSYYAITLKITDPSEQCSHDWSYPPAQKYFNFMNKRGYKILLSYGTGDGNMLDTKNLHYFAEKDLKNQKCELVTGDGGIEVSGDAYDLQELCNAKLFFSEIITALSINKKGGTFILKIYDSFFQLTLQLLQLLCRYYQNVKITKPLTSRPASSERYVVCEDYLGISEQDLNKLYQVLEQWVKIEPNIMSYLKNDKKVKQILQFPDDVEWLQSFENQLKLSNELCMKSQSKKILLGLQYCEKLQNQNDLEQIKQKRIQEQIKYAQLWCDFYNVPKIDNDYDD